MTRFRPNGGALLTLVAALLLATWPFFGTFTMGTLIAGFVLSLSMRSWHSQHPSTHSLPDKLERLPSEINLASIPVRGDVGGLIFAIGSVAILLALPQLRWFLIASFACAVAAGGALIAWRHTRVFSPGCEMSILDRPLGRA
jgi:hypothetical protein